MNNPPDSNTKPQALLTRLDRLARALETLTDTAKTEVIGLTKADAYLWDVHTHLLRPIDQVNFVPLGLLHGIDASRQTLIDNSLQFARGHAANNALLWGAKGMGKSSLIKAVHAHIRALEDSDLKRLVLVEINREDIGSLPELLRAISVLDAQFIIFCDDLSFDRDEADYKALKSILDGGLEGRPKNAIFYATSNRRHLMARDMIENEQTSAINPNEAIDEKVSLSDRFGLWLGFHNCSQEDYLTMIASYADHYGLEITADNLRARAIEWSSIRGARSGRVALQFVRQLAGEQGLKI